MNLSLHANGKNDHLATLAEDAKQQIARIKANIALSKEDKKAKITAVQTKLAQERKSAWSKFF